MKKIPTLFERVYDGHKIVDITDHYDPQFQWVFDGEGLATIKWDGSCCAVIDGEFYKRYDAKKGKLVPEGAIKCQENSDPVTGHLPCWVKCNREDPADKWFWSAYDHTDFDACWGIYGDQRKMNWTYEAVGSHFQGNPYKLEYDLLVPHGQDYVPMKHRAFSYIKYYLQLSNIEGIVFWKDHEPLVKIKASDFGFDWKKKAPEYGALLGFYAKH